MAEKDTQAEQEEQMRAEGSRTKRRVGGVRHCDNYGKTGHNSRTCQEDVEMDRESDSK